MKKNYFLTMVALLCTFLAQAQPSTPAPTPPTRNATDVLSIYSGNYTNLAGVNFNPDWSQSGFASATTFTVSGDEMRFYPNMNYQGIDFNGNINASNMTHVHFDIWTPASGTTATNFEFFLISPSPTQEQSFAVTPTAGSWTPVDIPLSSFPNVRLHSLFQLKMVATPGGTSSIYIDNIYFYKAANVPTITNFSVPAKTIGDAPFTITTPTSNSAGAFTYTSSNTTVATISGNTVTIVGVGSTNITASQAANGAFIAGSASTTLVVNPAATAPTTNASTPTKPSADVISLFSDAYTNVPVDTWRTSWSAATLTDETISGNNIKKYANLNFVGVEFHTPGPQINATTMDTFHVSVWTADATKFRVKLVDFGANGTFGGGDDTEAEIWFTSDPVDASLPNKYGSAPTQGQWNNLSIPLSFFASNGLTNRSKLSQLIFSSAVPGANTVFVDNIYFSRGTASAPTQPTTNAATPTKPSADVISLFSDAYTNVPVDTWRTSWSDATLTDQAISGNNIKRYSNLNFVGVEFHTPGPQINATAMDTFHISVWTSNATKFRVKLVDFGANSAFGGGDDTEAEIWFTSDPADASLPNRFGAAPTQGQWNNYSIPLSFFASNGLTNRSKLSQLILSGAVAGANTVFVDNIYFSKISAPLPTEPTTNAPNPTKPASNVISLFSDVYTNVPVDTWRTSWSDATLTDQAISGNNIKRYSNLNFVGIEFHTPGPQINATQADSFHISVWTANATKFRVKLVDFGANSAFGGGDDTEAEIWFTSDPADASLPNRYGAAPTLGQWNTYSIPMSFFASNGLANRNKLSQLILSAATPGANTVFVDNIYFSSQVALPVNFKGFEIVKQNKTAQLTWFVANEINLSEYIVEKSIDGRNFSALTTISAQGRNQYSAIDNNLVEGINYYRIKAVDKDGKFQYSVTRNIGYNANGNVVYSLYPNPAKNELVIKNLTGNNTISFIDITGRIVLRRNNVNNALASINISSLQNGLYTVVINNEDTTQSFKLIVEK